MTQAFGVNDGDVVVGAYQVGTGKSAMTARVHLGARIRLPERRRSLGVGCDDVNGINDHGRIVGFYTDSNGNTDGFLATPQD